MGIDVAVDELYSTGWSALDSAGCEPDAHGRWVPTAERVRAEFRGEGLELSILHVQLFDCYRAEWSAGAGLPAGGVVGSSEREAAVFALAQLRRSRSGVA